MTGVVIRRSLHAQNFTVIPNATARDTTISLTAHGLLVMLLSLPPEWSTTTDKIAEQYPDSQLRVRRAMRELREARYVLLHTERGERGRIASWWEVFDSPQPAEEKPTGRRKSNVRSHQAKRESSQVPPDVGNPTVGGPTSGNTTPYKKTDTKDGEERKKDEEDQVLPDEAANPAASSAPGSQTIKEAGEDDQVMSGKVITGPGGQADMFPDMPVPVPKGQTPTQRIIQAWIDERARAGVPRPPARRVGAVAKAVKQLVDEGIDLRHILAGVGEWDRSNMSVALLPDFVDDQLKRTGSYHRTSWKQRQSDAMLERSLARMRAADAADRKGVTGA